MSLRSLADSKTRISSTPSQPGSSKKSLLSPSSSQESAWTSSTSPSSLHLTFPTPLHNATHFAITFQGGFAASAVMVYVAMAPREGSSEVELGLMMARRVYPEDKSSRQVFEIPYPSNTLISPNTGSLPVSLSTDDLAITTERPPNPEGRKSPAPMHPAAVNNLPAGYQKSISSTLGSPSSPSTSAAKVNGSGAGGKKEMERVQSNESGVVRERMASGWTVPRLTELKLEFEGSSDNQGRVTVYAIEVLGA